MNRLIAAIAVFTTLLLTQSCSQEVKEGETHVSASPIAENNPHSRHEGHGTSDSQTQETLLESATTAKLTIPNQVKPKTPVSLIIDVQDKNGKAIQKFEIFQEQLMHLIVVSDDLQFFSHLHPTYKENGRFEVEANFPQSGGYTLFSDYNPADTPEQVSVLKTQVLDKTSDQPKIDLTTTKTFGDTIANLKFSQPTLKAEQEVVLTFDLKQTNNQPIADLQPYLGERGHLVILKNSSPLKRADYIHAHALKDTPLGKVNFITKFPKPGKYKLWGQFNRNGKIVTADFWVNVQ
jgi:hypothetical protein